MKTLINLASQNFRNFASTSNNTSIAYQEIKQHSKFSKTKFKKHDLLTAALRCFIFTVLVALSLVAQTRETNAANIAKPITASVLSAVMNLSDFFSIIAVLLIAVIAFYLSFKPTAGKAIKKRSF